MGRGIPHPRIILPLFWEVDVGQGHARDCVSVPVRPVRTEQSPTESPRNGMSDSNHATNDSLLTSASPRQNKSVPVIFS